MSVGVWLCIQCSCSFLLLTFLYERNIKLTEYVVKRIRYMPYFLGLAQRAAQSDLDMRRYSQTELFGYMPGANSRRCHVGRWLDSAAENGAIA